MIRLTVREGSTARTIRFETARLEIGSGPSPDASGARLAIDGVGVSPRHCLLRALRRGFEVVDLRSREGTILNGSRVSRSRVAPGDRLVLGSTSVILEELVADGPALPLPGDVALAPPSVPPLRPRTPAPGEPAADAPTDFNEALYRAVRGSPPLLLSIGLHAVAALLLVILTPDLPPAAVPSRTLLFESAENPAPVEIEKPEKTKEPEVPRPAPPLPVEPVPETREERREPEPLPVLPAETRGGDLPRDLSIGFGGRIRPPRNTPVDFETNPDFDKDGAEKINRAAAGKLVESLGSPGTGERNLLRRLDSRRILVVQGTWDRVEDVFTLLGISHGTLTMADLEDAPLPSDAILVIDCGDDVVSVAGAQRVREFVAAGGYLCTTDWGLENVLERTFPGVLRSTYDHGNGVSTAKEVVSLTITAPGDPLVRGLRAVAGESRWWVEDRAHPVKVLDPRRVTVLAESPEFRRRYGTGVLAAVFPWGRGRVLHLLGHAWQKEGNLKGAYGMQRLLVNFLLDRAATLPGGEEPSAIAPEPAGGRPRNR